MYVMTSERCNCIERHRILSRISVVFSVSCYFRIKTDKRGTYTRTCGRFWIEREGVV
jgi:hypothetical protein